jgi:hypothetical protein
MDDMQSDELEAAIDMWLQERLNTIPLEREAVALMSFIAECGDSIEPGEIAARYGALESYTRSERDLKEALEVISDVVAVAICGKASQETLEAIPEALQAATDDLWAAIAEVTAVAGA